MIPLFLTVLLLLGGCSPATDQEPTASSAYLTTTETVTASQTVATTAESSVIQTETMQAKTTTQPQTTAGQTSAATTQAQTVSSTETTVGATASAAQTETEKTTKSLWSIFGGNSSNNKKDTTAKAKENNGNTCFVTIRCEAIKDNLTALKKGKEAFVPESGVILDRTEVSFENGESAFDVVERACRDNVCTDNCQYCQKGGIQLEYNFTPAFGTYYIEGIHQLYEKDCGSMSGWMFSVNGGFPTEGSSSYTVKPGDEIVFAYTCDMGDDIGNAY